MYPHYALINGEKVKIKTDWRTALKCFEIIENSDIGDYERMLAVIYKLFGFVPKRSEQELYFEKARLFLQCGNDEDGTNEKPDIDLNYDISFISTSFLSDYKIDLEDIPDMHFWRFCELIQGLTENSILSRVRQIRTADLKDYTAKDKKTISKLKAQLALPEKRTAEENETSRRFWEQLGGD